MNKQASAWSCYGACADDTSLMSDGGIGDRIDSGIVMPVPVSVYADRFRHGIGSTMLKRGIEK